MKVIEISCLEVWREISNFLDGTKNVVKLVGDGVEYQMPEGFSKRLYDKIKDR